MRGLETLLCGFNAVVSGLTQARQHVDRALHGDRMLTGPYVSKLGDGQTKGTETLEMLLCCLDDVVPR